MKTVLSILIFVSLVNAQIKHEVCYRKTDANITPNVVTERCSILPPALRQAMNSWNVAQGKTVQVGTKPDETPITQVILPYSGLSNMVFSVLQTSLFSPALDQFPTISMKKLSDAGYAAASLKAAQTDAEVRTEKVTVLPAVPATEP